MATVSGKKQYDRALRRLERCLAAVCTAPQGTAGPVSDNGSPTASAKKREVLIAALLERYMKELGDHVPAGERLDKTFDISLGGVGRRWCDHEEPAPN